MRPANTLPAESRKILDSIPELINKTFPIPQRFRRQLPSNIAELSRLLTNKRGERSLSYLGRPHFLSAYLHYFLPWNLYRLCILLDGMNLNLSSGDTITDLGCGPFTFASALLIARPELRKIPLEINCIDRSAPVLEAGKNFFDALRAALPAASCSAPCAASWKINIIREDIDLRQAGKKIKKSALVCAVNLFNEVYENISHNNTAGLKNIALNAAQLMNNLTLENGSILTVEPGVPQSGKFISFLREAFIEQGRFPVSPCTHSGSCPANTREKRWCHFAYETTDAPKELHRLSAAAGIPKERLVLSYLLAGTLTETAHAEQAVHTEQAKPAAQAAHAKQAAIRVISDAFTLSGNRFGRYGCSEQGLVLLTAEKKHIEKIVSGSLVTTGYPLNTERDAKSGAIIVELK